ncbi:hypothetical protein B0H21DRAFT_691907 [Amylocystis lapponica]|nr:hypothetical protein B0H21DRAFT_691907 [Amylocystis lapponica]
MSVRPFSPSESWTFPKPPGTLTSSARSNTATLRSARSYIETNSDYATAPENPFADFVDDQSLDHPSSLLSVSVDSHFATVETICRPFVPTMSDEMSTAPGERVRMLQRFSDGWAYAEKVETGSRGLIPIDCLRTTDEDLPAFLASKRLSSYRGLNPSLSADGGRVTEFGQSKR